MSEALRFNGKVFRFGKYSVGISLRLIDFSNGSNGRVFFFPWTRFFK